MTDNNDINIRINYETDESSVARARKSADAVEAKITGIGKNIQRNFDKATDSVEKLSDEIRRDLVGAIREADNASARAGSRVSGRRLDTDFAGDTASSQAGLRGALDVFSGGNSGAAGNLLEFGEAIADIGEFAPKAASQLVTLAGAMGPAGLLAAGVAGVAVLALGVAIKALTDEATKSAEIVKAELDAERSIRERLAKGATSDEFLEELEEVQRLRAEEEKALAANQAIYDSYVNVQKDVGESALTAKDALQVLDHTEQVRVEDLDTSKQTIIDLNAREKELNETLAGTAVAANDAAEALRKEAEAKTKTTLDSASAAGQEETARRKAMDATEEQNQARLKSIEDERAALEAQLQVLQSSGDTSAEVTAQIDSLNGSLSALGKESDFIKNTALAASKARDAEKKAAKEAEQAAQKAAVAQEQYTNAVSSAKQAFADAKVDIKQGLKDTVAEMNRAFGDSLAEGAIEFNQQELKEEREHQRDLAGIRRDAQRTEAEATRERDFAALADARQDAADALAERQEEERAANDEQLTEFRQGQEAQARDRAIGLREAQIDSQRQLRDAATARDRGIRDAQAALDAQSKQQNQFYNNSLGMAEKYYASLMSLQSRAMGGGAAGDRQTGPGQRRTAPAGRGFEDMLNFVMN